MLRIPIIICVIALSLTDARGQGTTDYLNFESIQANPLAVAHVGGLDYLIACNTPDNSIEIYHVTDGVFESLGADGRVPVGLEPVSVAVEAISSQKADIYVCNFVGDSITHVRIGATPSALDPSIEWLRTVNVTDSAKTGDEPIDVAVLDDVVLVALRNSNSVALFDRTLNALPGSPVLIDRAQSPGTLKEPRRLAIARSPDGLQEDFVWVLDTQGSAEPANNFNLALYAGPMVGLRDTVGIDALGSANFGIAVGAGPNDTDDLYVVAQRARTDLVGEAMVADAEFGFAESWLIRITVDYVSGSGSIDERNLNRDVTLPNEIVPPAESVAQPMAVLPYYGGSAPVVFIASFGTDRVIRVGNLDLDPDQWTRDVFDIGVSGNGSPIAGPRGLALVPGSAPALDRLYILNRLDNSIAAIDPNAAPSGSPGSPGGPVIPDALAGDPTPTHVQVGREFLYSARLAANGFVSCASCHLDGRLDGLRWDLSDGVLQMFDPNELLDPPGIVVNSPWFIPNKGPMVTQSLQGLVNWEAELDRDAGLLTQTFFTNAPYHWRGDRADFTAFQGAFDNLIVTSVATVVDDAEMRQFERFINSIAYPPNPDQSVDRTLEGSLGSDPNKVDPAFVEIGSGPLLGLKVWHVLPGIASRSCVHCHSLPEGSNNKIPQLNTVFGMISAGNGPQTPTDRTNAESAALRGQRQKLIRSPDGERSTGGIGLFRFGSNVTPRSVSAAMIGVGFLPPDPAAIAAIREGVGDFVEQIDSGVAPMVGRVFTKTSGFTGQSGEVAEMIAQAEAGNIGIALHIWQGGVLRGYWYDQSSATQAGFREETPAGPGGSLSDFLALTSSLQKGDRVVIHATPLGSERRVASPSGSPANPAPVGPDPTLAGWIELAPNTFYAAVPLFLDNWTPRPDPSEPRRLPAQILPLQADEFPVVAGLILDGQEATGLWPKRHEPPRRIRIAGDGIRHGAQIEIRLDTTCADQIYDLRLPIYATGETHLGLRVWTTAVEAEPDQYYPWLDPVSNSHSIRVTNLDGSTACLDGVAMSLSEIPGFTRGDTNGDGGINTADFWALLGGGQFPCDDAADVDDDGDIDGDDLSALIAYFSGGQDPTLIPYPGPGICGPDLTEDALDCQAFTCP